MLADQGIRVNAVAPGPIWTPLIPSTMPPEKSAAFGEKTLIGRAGQPAELRVHMSCLRLTSAAT